MISLGMILTHYLSNDMLLHVNIQVNDRVADNGIIYLNSFKQGEV